jgi:hypothetical protein
VVEIVKVITTSSILEAVVIELEKNINKLILLKLKEWAPTSMSVTISKVCEDR